MRAVVQRVKQARVSVEGRVVGEIEVGLLVYLGVGSDDTRADVEYLGTKMVGLRIFSDEQGHLNLSASDLKKPILLISQFTLFGDVRRGKRPSFSSAMEPIEAYRMYHEMAAYIRSLGIQCEMGEFRAMMDVESINDGPVTILLDSKKAF